MEKNQFTIKQLKKIFDESMDFPTVLSEERERDEYKDFFNRNFSQYDIIDSPTAFYNYAVDFSRIDFYEEASIILNKGIEKYPHNLILMSCFLSNSLESQNNEHLRKAEKYSIILQELLKKEVNYSLPDIRCFQFLLDYLIAKYRDPWWISTNEDELDKLREDTYNSILQWENTLLEIYPKDERAWYLNSEIVSLKDDSEILEKKILVNALRKIKNCPRCSMKLADLEVKKGQYKKGLHYIKVCINTIEVNPSVKKAYAYFLLGFCKTAIFRKRYSGYLARKKSKNRKISSFFKKKVLNIYNDFSVAIGYIDESLNDKYFEKIEEQVFILENMTSVKYQGNTRPVQDILIS